MTSRGGGRRSRWSRISAAMWRRSSFASDERRRLSPRIGPWPSAARFETDDVACAAPSEVPAEDEDEDLRAHDRVAVVDLSEAECLDVRRGLGAREHVGQAADRLGRRSAHAARLLGRAAGDLGAKSLEDRLHLHEACQRLHLEATLEGRIARAEGEALGRRRLDAAPGEVPAMERLGRAAGHEVRLAEELPGVEPHQERQVGLLLEQRRVVALLVDDDLRDREREGRVGSGSHRDEEVRVDRRGVVVGCDHDEGRPVVAGLAEEVEVRDLRVGGVAAPREDEVRVEEALGRARRSDAAVGHRRALLLVADLRVGVEHHAVDRLGEALRRRVGRRADAVGADVHHDRVGAALGDRRHEPIGDLAEGLVPRDLLPRSRAARPLAAQRRQNARSALLERAVRAALLAAAGVRVGDSRMERGVRGGLLLADELAVLQVDVERAVGLVGAVVEVARLGSAIPRPAGAPAVLPAAARRRLGRRDGAAGRRRRRRVAPVAADRDGSPGDRGSGAGRLHELAPRDPGHVALPLRMRLAAYRETEGRPRRSPATLRSSSSSGQWMPWPSPSSSMRVR